MSDSTTSTATRELKRAGNLYVGDDHVRVGDDDHVRVADHHDHVRVAIIGGGPSGLLALKHLLQEGISNIKLFDSQQDIGGMSVHVLQSSS